MSVTNPSISGNASILQYNYCWDTEADTQSFCLRLARLLLSEPKWQDLYIELNGNLGAGKTTFTRYLLQALGVKGRIKSPTYAIVESYQLAEPRLDIWHFDCYRLAEPQEWEEAGFRDIFAQPGIKLVEWAQQAKGQLPPADIVLNIQIKQQRREVTVLTNSSIGATIIQQLSV